MTMADKKTEKLFHKALAATRTGKGRNLVFGHSPKPLKQPSARSLEKMFGLQEGETYEYEDQALSDEGTVKLGKHTGEIVYNENSGSYNVWVKGIGNVGYSPRSKEEAIANARRRIKTKITSGLGYTPRKGMMCPPAAELEKEFRITRKAANQIRALCKAADDPEKLEDLISKHHAKTERYVWSLHSSPYNSRMWRRTIVLHAIDQIIDGHGVEIIGDPVASGGPPYEYINMGDPYVATLIYKRDTDRLFIGSWGDVVEKNPKLEGNSY